MSLPSGASLPLVPPVIMYFLTGKHTRSIEPLTHTCMCCFSRVMYTDFSIWTFSKFQTQHPANKLSFSWKHCFTKFSVHSHTWGAFKASCRHLLAWIHTKCVDYWSFTSIIYSSLMRHMWSNTHQRWKMAHHRPSTPLHPSPPHQPPPNSVYQQPRCKALFWCSEAGMRRWRGRKQLGGEERGGRRWGTWRTVDELHRAGHQPDAFNEQSTAPNTSHLIAHTRIHTHWTIHIDAGSLFLPPILCSIPPSSTKYSLKIKQAAHSNQHTDEPFSRPLSPPPLPPLSLPCSNLLLFLSPFLPSPLAEGNTSAITQQTHCADTARDSPIKTYYLQTALWPKCGPDAHTNMTRVRARVSAKGRLYVIRSRLAEIAFCSLEQHVPALSHCIRSEAPDINLVFLGSS